jgi:hypothetical protein
MVGGCSVRSYVRGFGREFEDQWERVYVPVIGLKYQNMRCNLGNDVRAQYFGELHE